MHRATSFLSALALLATAFTSPASAVSSNFGPPVAVPSNFQAVSDRNVFLRKRNGVYLNGVRGHDRYRDGYRRSNGFWFPAAAFFGGVIIGGVIANQNNQYGNRHTRWCENRYRSYRISSNSYQPYHGPRRICYSPYN